MTPEQVELVKASWSNVVPIAGVAADLFYDTLFARDASLRVLFPSDMTEQKKKLMATLGSVVGALDDLPSVLPAVEALGKRHVGYGVKPEHYDTVGAVLLETLGQGLGPGFTPAVKQAWATAYATLASVMIAAPR